MSLPIPALDDRRFQDIVDQAKLLIPHYCPEWTDHNVSDPGVTLIELFAWMTDLLLYRVNQVPDKMFLTFLDMIGVRLDPPRAAQAPVSFYLSAAQPSDITIPEGTEVATVRTETNPAIIFTTEADLHVLTPDIRAALTRGPARGNDDGWSLHDLAQLQLPGQKIAMFPNPPTPGSSFYLCLERDHSNHILALVVNCELAGGAGVEPLNPPLEWQVWQGGLTRWVNCDLEHDGTGGFNRSGEIILHTPRMVEGEFQGITGYWLRCRLTEPADGQGFYRVSPDLEQVDVEARGGTIGARHATTVTGEHVGISDGNPGQTFRLLHTPLLARDLEREYLIVSTPGGEPERWYEVRDFADSGPEDRHYTLDSLSGELQLGPTLIQPDGSTYRFGAVPPKGSRLRFSRYRHGGGVAGNVARNMLTVPKSSIPYVAHVSNREAAIGGRDAQSLEDARLRAPQALRTRSRAVTADDFEYLACEVPGVARARCLAPGDQASGPGDVRPGQVAVVVLSGNADEGYIPPEQLGLSDDLRAAVTSHLSERCLVGIRLSVIPPQLFQVTVEAVVTVPERSDQEFARRLQRQAEDALYRYLNPYTGGPEQQGWPFGRALHISGIYGVLQRVSGVDFVQSVRLSVVEPSNPGVVRPVDTRLVLPPAGIICSGRHQVLVQ